MIFFFFNIISKNSNIIRISLLNFFMNEVVILKKLKRFFLNNILTKSNHFITKILFANLAHYINDYC